MTSRCSRRSAIACACLVAACEGSGLEKPGLLVATFPTDVSLLVPDGATLYAMTLDGAVSSVDTSSGNVQILQPPGTLASSVAVGPEQVFELMVDGTLRALPKSGGPLSTVISGEVTSYGLQFDGKRLWWVAGNPLAVRTLDPGATAARTVAFAVVRLLAADSSEAFWIDDQETLFRSIDGGAPTSVMPRVATATLALSGDWLWLGRGDVLSRIPRSGGPVEMFDRLKDGIIRLVATSDSVAFSTYQQIYPPPPEASLPFPARRRDPAGREESHHYEVYTVPAAGVGPILSGSGTDIGALAQVGRVVYWGERNRILRSQP
jgi:hypothetical protein